MDSETLSRLTSLAEKGGLPEGTALVDLLAEGVDQLMFLKGDKVAVLECLDFDNGTYLGYCEGVLGKFDRAHFSFESDVVLPSPTPPQPSSTPTSLPSPNPPLPSTITNVEEPITATISSSPPPTKTDSTPTHIELEEEQPSIPVETESATPSSSAPSSSSPPSPPELPLPVPRRRPVTSTFTRGGDTSNSSSEDLELELEKKRRRRGDPGAFVDFESFVLPSSLAGEQKLEVEEVEEKVEEGEMVVDLSKEPQDEDEEEEKQDVRSSRELNINIPPVDSTFEFDDGTLSRSVSASASPSTSGLSTFPPSPTLEQQSSRSSSPRPESTLGSNLGRDQRASSILDTAVLVPLPPTHETSPPPSDEPGLPTPPQSLEFHSLFPSEPAPSNSNSSRPLHDRNSYPRNASHPNELPTSATFPSPNPSPRRASTNSPLVTSPSPSPVKQLKSPSSRSLATKLASSFSSSTLATSSSHRDDDGEEEWDIFADYARASMYEPEFSMEVGSGSDATKKAARMSKRISRLPSSLSQEFSAAPVPSLPAPAAAPSSPPRYPRPSQSSVWNPRRPETLVLDSATPTESPVRTSVSMPISPSTPTHSFPDSPATLVGASIMNLASPTTPPSPTIGLAPESPEVNPLEELRAKSPSAGLGLASNLREMIKERNEALSRRGSEEEEGISQGLGKTSEEQEEKKEDEASTETIEVASDEPSHESTNDDEADPLATPQPPSIAILATSPVFSSMEEATPRIGSISDASKQSDFFTPSPSARSLKPSLTLTIDTKMSNASKSSKPTDLPSDNVSTERSRSSSAASHNESLPSPNAFHGRTDFDLASSPGPVPISFYVGNQNQVNGSPRQHPFSSVSPPLSPTASSVGLGLGIPSTSSAASSSTHSSAETAQGGWERSRSPPGAGGEFGAMAGEAGAGSFGRGSLSSLRGGAQPRPGFFPKERPRSRSFSSFSGQTVELGYPLYTPSSPGSPNAHQSSFVSLSSSPHFPPSTSGGFRDHRPALQSSLAIVSGGRYPFEQPQPPPPRPDTFGRRNSDRPRIQSPSSPLVPSQLSMQSSLPPRKEKDSPSPKTRGVEFPSSRQQASSPMGVSASAPSPTPPTAVVEPPTPKRGGFLNMFRSRSASMVGSRSSVPVLAALAPPVPLLPPTAAPPPPSPTQVKNESPFSPTANPFGPPITARSPSNPLPSPTRRAPSPSTSPLDLPPSNLLSPVTPETPSSPFSASPTYRQSPPRRVSTSTTASLQTGLSRQSSADATSIDLNPPTMGQGRSSTSLSSSHSMSLRSPKSMTKMRKSSGLSPSKRTVPLPPAVSSRDFQEEMVQEGGFEFELLKPLARKASLERRSSMDPLSSPVLDELHPPNVIVARRSASGPAGTPTPKPLPETDEYGFFLRPGRKSLKKQDGPTADEFRILEQKWLGIISSSTLVSVQKNKKNKKLVRGGLPASLRGRIWAFLLDSQSQRRQGLFDQLCVVSPATFEMEDAASKAFADHEQFNEPNSGRHDLLAVLRCYAQLNQPLGLQNGMGQIAGTLLMSAPAEDSFWLFASVIDSIRNLYKKDLAVESLVFVYLLESLDKALAKRIIVDCKIDPEMIISRWLQPMFVRTLPFATVLRIWDVVFFEGPSYLLRIALAIVLSARTRLLDMKAMTSVEHIKLYLQTPPHDHLLSVDTLIPLADGLKISTKDEDLRKLRSKAMMALEEGRAAMRAARRAAGVATTPTTPGLGGGANYKR